MNNRLMLLLALIVPPGYYMSQDIEQRSPAHDAQYVASAKVATDLSGEATDPVYTGFIMRWGWEGSCVGGDDYLANENPDLMDVWLVTAGTEPDLYIGHTEHSWPGGCTPHTATWQNHPMLDTGCSGGECLMVDGNVGKHRHSPTCWH